MKKSIATVSILLSLLGGLPIAAQAQPASEPVNTFLNIKGPAIDFGKVAVGSSATTSVGGTNNTGFVLTVYAALGGPDAGEFSIANSCSGIALIQGATCTGTIGFAPRSAGPKNAELIIVMRGVQEQTGCFTGDVVGAACDTSSTSEYMETTRQFLYTQTHALSGVGQ